VVVPGAGRLSDGGEQPPHGGTGGTVAAEVSPARLRVQPAPGPGLGEETTPLLRMPPAAYPGPTGEWLWGVVTGRGLNPLPAGLGRAAPAQAGTAAAAGAPSPARHSVGADLGQILAQAFYLANLKQVGTNPGPQAGLLQPPGDTRLLVADLVQRSTEAFTCLVQAFYAHLLGRAAAAGEAGGWVSMLLNGQTEEQVLSAFLSTAEFYTRAGALVPAGTGDERFIRALYDLLLQRPASDAEVSGWLGALPGLGRGGVASALLASVEYRSRRVEALYQDLLGRPAAPAEAASWAGSPFDLLTIRLLFENHPDLVTASGPR
jgi:hypothetical protein